MGLIHKALTLIDLNHKAKLGDNAHHPLHQILYSSFEGLLMLVVAFETIGDRGA